MDFYEFSHVVAKADSAEALGLAEDDRFPDVLATSRMIGLMEVAAARLMQPQLTPGSLSVGVEVEVRHLKATPVGQEVRFRAELIGPASGLYEFRVTAIDIGGVVGRGRHTRAIVDVERFMVSAQRRVEPSV
jgi:fluoroacetyl-CoA thioesterase